LEAVERRPKEVKEKYRGSSKDSGMPVSTDSTSREKKHRKKGKPGAKKGYRR